MKNLSPSKRKELEKKKREEEESYGARKAKGVRAKIIMRVCTGKMRKIPGKMREDHLTIRRVSKRNRECS